MMRQAKRTEIATPAAKKNRTSNAGSMRGSSITLINAPSIRIRTTKASERAVRAVHGVTVMVASEGVRQKEQARVIYGGWSPGTRRFYGW